MQKQDVHPVAEKVKSILSDNFVSKNTKKIIMDLLDIIEILNENNEKIEKRIKDLEKRKANVLIVIE